MINRRIVTLLTTMLIVICIAKISCAESADTIYTKGKIYTVNEAQPWAEAVAIKDGKFIKVGSEPTLYAAPPSDLAVLRINVQSTYITEL